MYKTFCQTCILGCAIADTFTEGDVTIKEGIKLQTVKSGDVTSEGQIFEGTGSAKDVTSGKEIRMVSFMMGWTTKNEKAAFEDGSWI